MTGPLPGDQPLPLDLGATVVGWLDDRDGQAHAIRSTPIGPETVCGHPAPPTETTHRPAGIPCPDCLKALR